MNTKQIKKDKYETNWFCYYLSIYRYEALPPRADGRQGIIQIIMCRGLFEDYDAVCGLVDADFVSEVDGGAVVDRGDVDATADEFVDEGAVVG